MENNNLVRRIAWSFSTSTGLSFDDLYQEGIIAYLEALKTYDKDKGRISTYMWACISNQLKNYVKEENKHRDNTVSIVEIVPSEFGEDLPANEFEHELIDNDFDRQISFMESLTKGASELLDVIIDSQMELLCLNKNDVNDKIKEKMKVSGWKRNKILGDLKELKIAYS